MEGLYRRSSGVYVARLAVPLRHQATLGKTEFIASTGTRELVIARMVAGEVVAGWRRHLHNLDRLSAGMDILQLTLGFPALRAPGYLSLKQAAAYSGLDEFKLLREAASGQLNLFVRVTNMVGHVISEDDLEASSADGVQELIVPTPDQMPEHAQRMTHNGLLRLLEPKVFADALLSGEAPVAVVLSLMDATHALFAPSKRPHEAIQQRDIELSTVEVERLRAKWASTVTQADLSAARQQTQAPAVKATHPNADRLLSDAINQFLADKASNCQPDHARRIRSACDLFVELEGDRPVGEITRDHLRTYMSGKLRLVPANENKVRLKFGSTSISESISKVDGSDWPRISDAEAKKRMQWLCELFGWLVQEQWIERDPSGGLSAKVAQQGGQGHKTAPASHSRDAFTRGELKQIFSEPWFKDGHGELTKAGTYRTFMPFYYWGPLLALFTGARINELAQLDLTDFKLAPDGTLILSFNELSADDPGSRSPTKKLKTKNSERSIPIHPLLNDLGLPAWLGALAGTGQSRLFPELKHDSVKGHGKAATKWFSKLLGGYGWPRDGRKVFHSFRHTLATECQTTLQMTEAETAHVTGHKRGQTITGTVYRHDADALSLMPKIRLLDFGLPVIARFDVCAGLQAVSDALGRKGRDNGVQQG